jgi:hypothetical protein
MVLSFILQKKGCGSVPLNLTFKIQDGMHTFYATICKVFFFVLAARIMGSTDKDWTTCCADARTCEKV